MLRCLAALLVLQEASAAAPAAICKEQPGVQMLQRRTHVGKTMGSGANSSAGGQSAELPLTVPGRCDSDRVPLGSRCTGCPPTFNGKPCASTSRYFDVTKAACGCSEPHRDYQEDPSELWWPFVSYTAAFNCANNNPSEPTQSWCPTSCGQCYRLCSTGGSINNNRTDDDAEDTCRVFQITNNCADGFPHTPGEPQGDWCSQNISFAACASDPAACQAKGNTNMFGYPAHFDLMDYHGQITHKLGWDNAEVTFEMVDCQSEFDGPVWDCQCEQSTAHLQSLSQ